MTIRAQLVITATEQIPNVTTITFAISAKSAFGDVADLITLIAITSGAVAGVDNGDGTWTFTRPDAGTADAVYAIVASKAGYPSVTQQILVLQQAVIGDAGGGVTGSGTTGTLPVWTGASALGDSSVVESGTQLTAAKPLVLPASTTTLAPINLPPGAAPTSPVDGDIWVTSAGVYGRVAGVTVGPFGAGGGGGMLQQVVTLSNSDILTLSSVGKAAGLSIADGFYPVLVSATLWIDSTAAAYTGIDSNCLLYVAMAGQQASTILSEAANDSSFSFPFSTQGGEIKKLFGLGENAWLAYFGPLGAVQTVGPIAWSGSPGTGPSEGVESGNVIGGLAANDSHTGADFTLQLQNPDTGSSDLGGGDGANTGKWIIDYVLHAD